MKTIMKILTTTATTAIMLSTILPIVSCSTKVKMSIKDRQVWFKACDMFDLTSLKSNFSVIRESIIEGIPGPTTSFKIDKDRYQAYSTAGNLADYSIYNFNFNKWFTFYTSSCTWNFNSIDEMDITKWPNIFKDYFDNHQNRFEWSSESENKVKIEFLHNDDFDNAEIEFYDDTKYFKTIYLWSPQKDNDAFRSHKFIFSHYNTTLMDNDFPTDFYNTKSINTTNTRKFSIYDRYFPADVTSPKKFKLHLSSSIGSLPMWIETDDQNLPIIKANGESKNFPLKQAVWNPTTKELTFDNQTSNIAPGDRLFVSISYPQGIVANNIKLEYEEIPV